MLVELKNKKKEKGEKEKMKIKKVALIGTFAALAALSLASCGDNKKPAGSTSGTTAQGSASGTEDTPKGDYSAPVVDSNLPLATVEDNGGLDIYLNYKATAGITARTSFNNKVENKTYVQGDMLPVFKAFQTKLNTTLRDASDYVGDSDDKSYANVSQKEYKSLVDNTKYIDLFYNSTTNINKAGEAGDVVNLKDYLDYMPNFKAFLENNPSVRRSLEYNDSIYYTPYFDGYNSIERSFVADTKMVELVLDGENDTTKDTATDQGHREKGIAAVKYQPFINADYNYADSELKLVVSKDAKAKYITVKKTENIIKQQNASLAAGTSGAQLRAQLRKYLNDAFGDEIGEGKTYSKLSEIYTSESAAYNTDELIALMRVIKASSELISGDANTEIETFLPRGDKDGSRTANILDMMKIFGIQGLDSEANDLYYDADGNLNYLGTTQAAYDALELMSQIYDEGLILGKFHYKPSSGAANDAYITKYFGHTAAENTLGYGFMIYDYTASTTGAANTQSNGIGVLDSNRKGVFANTEYKGFMPILSPITYWATEKGYDASTTRLTDRSKMSLLRYEESNRALKTTAWSIPSNSDNKQKAAQLMDYLFTTEGRRVNDFGPESYWKDGKADSFTYQTEKTPTFCDGLKEMISDLKGSDFWTFMRNTLGATHGIGYVRTSSINYQATNDYAKVGQNKLDNSIASGATKLCLDKRDIGFGTSVPSAGYNTVTSNDDKAKYAAVASFWTSEKDTLLLTADEGNGWVKYIESPAGTITDASNMGSHHKNAGATGTYTFGTVKTQIAAANTIYLYTLADTFDAVPAYARKTA